MNNPRTVAARILAALLAERGSLSSQLEQHRGHPELPLIQEYCYGCCRWWYLLRYLLACLLPRPLKTKDHDVLGLLLVGLYQIRQLRTPHHAAIHETVGAATELRKPWAKSLLNGVLRNYLRQQQELDSQASRQRLAVTSSHPDWLVAALQRQWPDTTTAMLHSNNLRPPMTLRVNLARQSRAAYCKMLTAAHIGFSCGRLADCAVYLQQPMPVSELPGFASGLVSIQDEASQLVAPLLDLQAGQRLLDACCAPGGKLCHLLESERSPGEVVALERNPVRLRRVMENLQRLGLHADVRKADATRLDTWWDGQAFDRILLDAPCSATGVIRRHPDIKLLRSAQAIDRLQQQQLQLLHALWPALASGGLLLYTTCSVLPAENSELIGRFLHTRQDAEYTGIRVDWGVECDLGRQLLPLQPVGPDGFFYSLLRKT